MFWWSECNQPLTKVTWVLIVSSWFNSLWFYRSFAGVSFRIFATFLIVNSHEKRILLLCCSIRYPSPHGGQFCLRPVQPPGMEIPGGTCHTPPPPPTFWISVIFRLVWVPPGKNISLKNAVALYFYATDNCVTVNTTICCETKQQIDNQVY